MTYEGLLYAEMNPGTVLPLASIEAVRPVFMIVMGISLMVTAWRLSQLTRGWTARLIVSGAFLLGMGYSVMMPLYEAGRIERLSPTGGSSANAVACHAVKVFAMNSGWLLFGLGLAMHAKVFNSPVLRQNLCNSLTSRERAA